MSAKENLRYAIISVGISALALYASPQDSKDIDLIRLSSNNTIGPTPDMVTASLNPDDGLTPTSTPVPTVGLTPTPTRVSEPTSESVVPIPSSNPINRPNYESNQPPVDVREGPDLQFAQDIFNETNLARVRFGLPAYFYRSALTATAQKYSEFLASLFEQGLPIGHLEDGNLQERALREGYEGGIAENIAGNKLLTEFNAEYWVNQWLGSPGHRANILNPDYKDFGVGCAVAYLKLNPYSSPLDYTRICVQNFGMEYEWDGTPGPVFVPTPTATPIPTPTAESTPTPEPTFTPTPEPTSTPTTGPSPTPTP